RGDAFAETLARFPDLYDRKLTALVRVGEQTNRLPEMLRRQGETLTEELEYAIRRMGAMLEPALILLVGILVAVILIAMYMPMFSLGGIMG
ncbi:type II secretion system F family protein, partial [Alistipes communis]